MPTLQWAAVRRAAQAAPRRTARAAGQAVADADASASLEAERSADEWFVVAVEAETQRDRLRRELEEAWLELEEAQREIDAAQAEVRRLQLRLKARGDASAFVRGPASALPEDVDTFAALLEAAEGCDLLHIGDTREAAEVLDLYEKRGVWARKAWRSLRALQSYASARRDGFEGDFHAYNEAPPTGRATRIPLAWIARAESRSVDTNPRYRAARTFPVPPWVAPAGEVYMDWHIRLERGQDPAPRMHFHDDTARTGDLYVGYIGPHLPNDSTN